MRKFLTGSLALHAALVLIGGFLLCPWAEQACPRSEHAIIDVDVFHIAKKTQMYAAENSKRTELKQQSQTHAETQPEQAVFPANEVRISKQDGGTDATLTIEDYMHWVIKHNKAPIYPRLAQLRNEEGRAVLEISVSRDGGRLQDVKLVQSSGSALLDEVSLSTVKDWRFARFESQEASIRFRVPFRFALR